LTIKATVIGHVVNLGVDYSGVYTSCISIIRPHFRLL